MSNELWIYDAIGSDDYGTGVTPASVRDDLRQIPAKERVLVRINSPGGDVFAAVAIRQILAERKAGYDVQVDGLSASAATFFINKGSHVTMARGSRIMVHPPWGVTIGDSAAHHSNATILSGIAEEMISAYVERTGKTAAAVRAVVEADGGRGTYFNADEAIAFGLADEKAGGESLAASAAEESVIKAADIALVAAARTRIHMAARQRHLDLLRSSVGR